MHSGQIPCPADGSVSPGWAQVSSPSYLLVPSALVFCEAAAFILTHCTEPGSAATSPKNLICYNFLLSSMEPNFTEQRRVTF